MVSLFSPGKFKIFCVGVRIKRQIHFLTLFYEISKKSTRQKKLVPPTVEEVASYCLERKNKVDAAYFVDHYTSNGWKVGKQNMKDWKAAVRTWEKNGYNQPSKKQDAVEPNGYSFDLEEYERSHKYAGPELSEEK